MPGQAANSGTVMYVEDEENDAFLMQVAFNKAGLGPTLRVVGDGRAAMKYLTGDNGFQDRGRYPMPTVLLLDLNLPDISGFDVLAWLRSRDEFQALPVVIFSSSVREEDKQKARELGASEYLEKPISALRFGSVVERIREKWLSG